MTSGGNNFPENELIKFRAVFHPAGSELDMDWIHPLIALGWPGLGEISGN